MGVQCTLYIYQQNYNNITFIYAYIEKDSSLMVTSSGAPVWRGTDAVHLSDEAYAEVAAALVSCASPAPDTSCKRARLESVVPGPPPKHGRVGPAIRPSPWVSGAVGSDAVGVFGRGRGRGGVNRVAFRGSTNWRFQRGRGRGSGRSRGYWGPNPYKYRKN